MVIMVGIYKLHHFTHGMSPYYYFVGGFLMILPHFPHFIFPTLLFRTEVEDLEEEVLTPLGQFLSEGHGCCDRELSAVVQRGGTATAFLAHCQDLFCIVETTTVSSRANSGNSGYTTCYDCTLPC